MSSHWHYIHPLLNFFPFANKEEILRNSNMAFPILNRFPFKDNRLIPLTSIFLLVVSRFISAESKRRATTFNALPVSMLPDDAIWILIMVATKAFIRYCFNGFRIGLCALAGCLCASPGPLYSMHFYSSPKVIIRVKHEF